MDIKTRFDCGQLVYIIGLAEDLNMWQVMAQVQVHGINARIINNKINIVYTIEFEGKRYPEVKESHLFTTRIKAQASCFSRNERMSENEEK